MTSERSQLYYTCVFLQVSFQAVIHSVTADTEKTGRCWLDAQMLEMLLAELKRCQQSASPFHDVQSSLDQATYHCGLLMAQCPGALDRHLCLHHLEAITAPLGMAIRQLTGIASARVSSAPASSRGFRHWFGR